MTLSDGELKRIATYMKDHYGVELFKKQTLISGRLENKLTGLGFTSYDEFMARVEAKPDGEEAHLLVNTLTTNHTYFMRESVHFDFMRETALPEIRRMADRTHDLRIWSAASSSGEEAYSIVMTLKDYFGFDAENWDTKVLATDISTKALEKASEGLYRADQLEDLPTRWISTYFTKEAENEYRVKPALRDEVIFHTFNLMEPFNWKHKFHIIFLRNVMIYFDEATKATLIRKIYRYLEPGGYLFIGTTETIDTEGTGLAHVKPSIYRRIR